MKNSNSLRNEEISKRDLLLLLLAIDVDGVRTKGVSGITRLQKLLFLLWKEVGIQAVQVAYSFKPYKAGPYSRKLYDELEFLENIGLIKSEVEGKVSEVEVAELEDLSFEQLMGQDADPYVDSPTSAEAMTADTYEERRYSLTPEGVSKAKSLLEGDVSENVIEGIRRIKSKFGNFSLQDLLYYVYTKYEDGGWTSESEIRKQVLARGSR